LILVTGAAGFVGAHVARALCDAGHEVLGIDNLNDSYSPVLKRWRVEVFLRSSPGFTFHHSDITDLQALRQAVGARKIEAVMNFAARAGVAPSVRDPWAYYDSNVAGTLNLLELCREADVPKFVLASTSSAYGNAERPFSESAPANQPLSPYAASKKSAELLCYTYHHLHGVDISVLRLFTVYGPAGRPDMSVYRFIHWISHRKPVLLRGDGLQERDFTFVGDVTRGAIAALMPLGHEVVNLGSDRPVSLLRVISLLEDRIGARAAIEHGAADPFDVRATWADIGKARKLLSWEPLTSLEEGLTRTAEWHLANRELTDRIPLP